MRNTRSKLKREEKGFTLIELIIVIVILGIVAGAALPMFMDLSDEARTSAARGVAGAMGSTIVARQANYMLDSTNTYDAAAIIADTQFEGGINTPTNGTNIIYWTSGAKNYIWNYTAVSGDTSAYLTEFVGANSNF